MALLRRHTRLQLRRALTLVEEATYDSHYRAKSNQQDWEVIPCIRIVSPHALPYCGDSSHYIRINLMDAGI